MSSRTSSFGGVVLCCEGISISGNFYRNKLNYLTFLCKQINTTPLLRPLPLLNPQRPKARCSTRPSEARPLWTTSRSLKGSHHPMTRKSTQWFLPPSRLHW
ncbi:hypothetical protein Celaphus_00014898 [Cervus elaphus hippelaphus]|uniref:Uncharacterized protein n=1 Tax=Cervus elaphus hippelaphus TaxID=46360 RepID=A0A212D3M4_CEREH|nr:hypothetical protein Celaphus_00014898 [Cervus elaphus hippelaphus]